MERQFNNGDFEKLLRDNANQYRMYPSEKVWKGIHSALHSRRRWYGLSAIIMFLVTSSIVSLFVFNGGNENQQLVDQKNNATGQVNDQPAAPTAVESFTPEIKKNTAVRQQSIYTTGSYRNSPVFNITNIDLPQQNADLNAIGTLSENENIYKGDPLNSEVLMNRNFPVSFNDAVLAEDSKNPLVIGEKFIVDQNTLDRETEKRISDAISALASQNVSFQAPKKQARVTAQVFFTPTISYRKLTENKDNGSGFAYVPSITLNNIVNHKPLMGLEFGMEGRYRLNDKVFLKSGLQFNINRYDIRAYSHPTEIATVALNSGNRIDSLASLSNYRNFSGTSANWLENFYFQIGAPVGAEVILSDKNDIQWGISGTIQPTYVIGDRAYLISSDYKNYAKFPDLMRRWNVSTGLGAFVSYSTGRIKWQAGPHVRYQHLSSFVSELSVKENLFAIGLKVGATLNNNKK